MGFMSAYKHLDTICRDMNGIGVSGYIEDMERNRQGVRAVQGWDSDYQQLKHYRWVRNQIAHEMNAEEDNMCTLEDTQWLENFYRRIMNCSDPLARYTAMQRATAAKRTAPRPAQDKRMPVQEATRTAPRPVYVPVQETKRPNENHTQRHSGWLIFILLVVIAVIVWRIAAGT